MKTTKHLCLFFLWCAVCTSMLFADEKTVKTQEWTVNHVKREASISLPKTTKEAPIVFVFHGHGGSKENSVKRMNMHQYWPEAVCIYPQGLKTPGKLTDPQGLKTGWQITAKTEDDRDLNFFDSMLSWAKKELQIDSKKVFVTGHSNGGAFTYLLLTERGKEITAIAPSAAASLKDLKNFKPKPAIVFTCEKDPLVKFEWQKSTFEALIRINQCDKSAKQWNDVKNSKLYESKDGNNVVVIYHDNGHTFDEEWHKLTADFFKSLKIKE